MTDSVPEQSVRHKPSRRDEPRGDRRERGPLPDHTGLDLVALRAGVEHRALDSVLATLLVRARRADGGFMAYHEDSPGVDD
ncbi:hypothetical protein [Streptomyces sp. NPDC126522]|uniref:hypothetical protein n=1 Tax=Streptomyces sp. NPDC126522 TaxID=3155211 RepID=UPI003323D4C6